MITYNEKHFIKDGKPWLPIMGEYEYSRTERGDWARGIAKMKALGLNTVQCYSIWLHHEEIKGHFDFRGNKNLRAFVRLVKEAGMKMCLRVGPWVHAELRAGGFPDWIFDRPYRRRTDDPEYLADVRLYFEELDRQCEGYLDKDGNDYAECFKYEEYGNGYMIVGTTNEGKLSKVLEVPSSYNGRPVIAIGEEAFSGCSMLMKLTIHRSITAFYDGIFTKCPHLDEVYFDYDDAPFMEDEEGALPQVSVELLRGAEADLRIYLSRECFERFVGDYNWQRYAQYFEIGEVE